MSAAADEILVIGHRNPDTDAACSALAYADLYTRMTGAPTAACHLDELGPETVWLLDYLGLEPPRPITDVYLRVGDMMITDTPVVGPDDTLRHAGLLMRDHELGALPVLDGEGRLAGVLARELLADRYLEWLRLNAQLRRQLSVIRDTLEAELLAGDAAADLDGQVWLGTFSPEAAHAHIRPGDILLVEDDAELQMAALAAGAGCLIVARGAPVAAQALARAAQMGAAVLRTPHGSLATAGLLEQSSPVADLMQRDPLKVSPDDLLGEALQHLRSGHLACLPVVSAGGHHVGLLLRRHLVPQTQRRIILTDHNHPGQAAPGVAESAVIAIIDHHNLGGLQTLQPLLMQVEPVGCTCTLIAEGYQRAALSPPPALAGAMLGAILSDTVGFRSPTTTPRDRAAADWLATLSGERPHELARRMFRARLPEPLPPAEWWVGRDWKTYTFSGTSLGIAQVELVDVEQVAPPVTALRHALAEAAARAGLATAFVLLTDIFDQRSVLLAANEAGEQLAARAFGGGFASHQLVLPGVVSRKQQVVPAIASALLR